MKITLESTDAFKMINGVRCRVWEGTTDAGIGCFALIPQIAHHASDDCRAHEFVRDLQEHKRPSDRAIECFDLRYFID